MSTVRDDGPVPANGVDSDALSWEQIGVATDEVAGWEAIGFGPFEAALAHGDGYTPLNAEVYRHQLQRTARSWVRNGLGSIEGLKWHRAGFGAREASRWLRRGFDFETARARRSGYETVPTTFRQ